MAVLYILIGIPASGKSTWASKIPKIQTVSSDSIREELYGDASIQGDGQKVFQLVHKRIFENLANGLDTAYDAMNISRKYRIAFLKEVRAKYPNVHIRGIIFATPFEQCLKGNAERERHVPIEVMVRAYKGFNMPSIQEGFDSIDYIRRSNDTCYLPKKLVESFEISQDNPHHTFTIGKHCAEAYLYTKKNREQIVRSLDVQWAREISLAAVFHDIGKAYCKTFIKPNGQRDDKAHFYSHENVGAYDFLCYANDYNVRIENVALLINLHMIHYMDKKYQEKMKKLYGSEIWEALEWLNRADLAAH